jgi:hypothetical protein
MSAGRFCRQASGLKKQGHRSAAACGTFDIAANFATGFGMYLL